jgi:GDPmannose 4,6-dehydratase
MSENPKVASITGVTGQDRACLTELLLNKGYAVHGIRRCASIFNAYRIDHLYRDRHHKGVNSFLHHGDLTDSSKIIRIVQETRSNEIYNLAAQSHVAVSFEEPECTANSDARGALSILEAIRILDLEKKTRFYHASTSALYGLVQEIPPKETTSFYPRRPYAIAKLYAYWITVNYREAYGIYACNGILFNHESPLPGETFVTRKIARALARISLGLQDCLYLGNLDSKRDWGHARDYVEMQLLMLQQDKLEDFVIAAGEHHTVREFADKVATHLGMTLRWEGFGVSEKAFDARNRCVIAVDPRYSRPTEVDGLLGDATKARNMLNWVPKTSFEQLVDEMMEHDLDAAKKSSLIKQHGFRDRRKWLM